MKHYVKACGFFPFDEKLYGSFFSYSLTYAGRLVELQFPPAGNINLEYKTASVLIMCI